jgi:hypothetical protein
VPTVDPLDGDQPGGALGLAQDTGTSQRLCFRSGLTTVLLTPAALPSRVLSYTLTSQALSAPCGSL